MTRKLDISEKKKKKKKKKHQWYCIGPLVREHVKDKILYRWLDIRLEHSIWF